MKKIISLLSLFLIAGSLIAQPGSFDVKGISTQIVTKLTESLSLNADQAVQTSEAVTEFLSQKVEILPLQSTDPAAYSSKFNILNGTLVNKLKAFFQARQMTTFWSLKPRSNDPANVLSHLFY